MTWALMACTVGSHWAALLTVCLEDRQSSQPGSSKWAHPRQSTGRGRVCKPDKLAQTCAQLTAFSLPGHPNQSLPAVKLPARNHTVWLQSCKAHLAAPWARQAPS